MLESAADSAQAVVAVVVLLGACIFFHEAGHFVVAKLAGMLVHEFACGFGPRLITFTRGETLYSIRLVPLGGYVRIAGMDPEEREVARGFYSFPRWQGFTVLVAGSLMNVVLAALAFMTIAVAIGLPIFGDYTIRVAKVFPDGAAEAAGLQPGDDILRVDGIGQSLFIEKVQPGGPAAHAGLRANDLIYQVGEEEVAVPSDLLGAVRRRGSGSVELGIASADDKGDMAETPSVQLAVPESLLKGQVIELETAPEIRDGVCLVPLREIVEYGQGQVAQSPADNSLRVVRGDTEVRLQIGDPAARVNDEERTLEMAPYATGGRTMVPLEFIAEALDMDVSFDAESGRLRERVKGTTKAQAGQVVEEALGVGLAPLDRTSLVRYISERPEEEVTLTIKRQGRELDIRVTTQVEWARVPTEDEQGRRAYPHRKVGRIGVVLTGAREAVGLGRAIVYGGERSVEAVAMVAYGIKEMILRRVAVEASGPVGIAAMTAESAKMGWAAVARLVGFISVNLAVLNLFPIPPFDGFRIVLLGIEGIMGQRVDAKKEIAVTIAGVALLLGLFLVITFRDILNLVFYSTP